MHSAIRAEMVTAFENFYDSYWYVLGDRLVQFEKAYSGFNQIKHTVGISNGLDAIYLALKSLEIQAGDEVIMPSNTFIATVLAVSYTGATPVFVEPDLETYLLDPTKLEAAITSQTKAIIPVHLYGQACQMVEIGAIASRFGLKVIEDNAQAHGALYQGRMTGTFGEINATSFYPGKNLGALGDAGAITTQDDSLAAKSKMLRNYGSQQKYTHEVIGHNMRMDELQAAFLSVKLNYLDEWTAKRQEIATRYREQLASCDLIVLPAVHPDATHVYHLFVIRTERRDELQVFLQDKGIGTLIHYPIPPHLQKAYEHLGYKKGDFPIAEELAQTSLSLPIWPGMDFDQIDFISNQIKSFFS
ncbi:DegT/DnrJ/EryC1/StrS family aminotransferase [Algoriphagus antarcticus]|nr:DegT/DnrJ/EryC1/StrS family aminotransferase [Algoriphagus antarcticus]